MYIPYFTTVCNGKISEQHLILFVNQMPTDLWFSPQAGGHLLFWLIIH